MEHPMLGRQCTRQKDGQAAEDIVLHPFRAFVLPHSICHESLAWMWSPFSRGNY